MHLSKTNYITWRDCKKNAWLKMHKPDIYYSFPLSSFEQNIIDIGNEIDLLARKLFPGGVEVEDREDTAYTEKLLKEKTKVIYQPVFKSEKYITASDIFVLNEDTGLYDLYEVKASTSSEDDGGRKTKDYIIDMAFQKAVLEEVGVKIGKTNLIRLNKEFVKDGEINLWDLFLIEDLSGEVNEELPEVKANMEFAYEYLMKEEEPQGHCDCIYRGLNGHCTTAKYSIPDLPEYPVHQISRIHKNKLTALIDSFIYNIHDVPEDFPLSEAQRRQVDTAQSGKEQIDRRGIKEFLETIQYPIAFLDYETYPAALPRFDGYRPYQQIPFQFSLHIKESKDSELSHHEFLYTDEGNPDEEFVLALEKYLPEKGSVIVWNKKFEQGINTQIGERLSGHSEFLKGVNDRVVDLMVPFSGKTNVYDHPKFKGSASIKYVLPALVPELSYKNLEIQEGGTASDTWNRIATGEYKDEEAKQKREALLKYCELDTLAMVRIWEVLEDRV